MAESRKQLREIEGRIGSEIFIRKMISQLEDEFVMEKFAAAVGMDKLRHNTGDYSDMSFRISQSWWEESGMNSDLMRLN
jgi:hypothetical protein